MYNTTYKLQTRSFKIFGVEFPFSILTHIYEIDENFN
jgi:hypothetical protein